jgi:hypothetical protein
MLKTAYQAAMPFSPSSILPNPTKLQLEIRESSLPSQDPATADVLQSFIDLSSSLPQNLTLEWLESRILDIQNR